MGKRKKIKKRKKNRNRVNLKRQNNEKVNSNIKLVANENYSMKTSCVPKKTIRQYSLSMPFVPKSCIVPANFKQPKIISSFSKPLLLNTDQFSPHIYAPNFRVRRANKNRYANSAFVPYSCVIQISDHPTITKSFKYSQPIIPAPPKISTTSVIVGPKGAVKRNQSSIKAFVPKSCVIINNSLAPKCVNKNRNKANHPFITCKPPVPNIISLNKLVRKKQTLGKNTVIVPNSCIIKSKPLTETRDYDWRKAFPKPVYIEKAADIVGPNIKFRSKKSVISNVSFVPQSCIIPNSISPGGTSKKTSDRIRSIDALAQLPPGQVDNEGSNLFLAVAAVIIIIALAFYFIN